MKQPLFISNTPIDEKRISFIEKVVARLTRRARKTAKAIIPSVPIMGCVIGEDISGCIIKSLIFEGKLVKLAVKLNIKPRGPVWIDVRTGSEGAQYKLEKQFQVFFLDLNPIDGDLLTVTIESTEEDKIEEVLLTLLWQPAKSSIEIKNILISELEEHAGLLIEEDS